MAPNKIEAPWKQWCRLCATKDMQTKSAPQSELTQISPTDEVEATQIAEMLHKFFSIKLEKLLEKKSLLLCQQCRQRLLELHTFVQHVERVQIMFNDLKALEKTRKNTKNWSEVYRKFDFIACEPDEPVTIQHTNSTQEDDDVDEPTMSLDMTDDKPQQDSLEINREALIMDIKIEDSTISDTDSKPNDFTANNECYEDSASSDVSYEPTQKTRKKRIKTRTKFFNPKPQHICSQCKLGYMSFSRYRRHMQVKHKQSITPQHQCTECSRSFTTELKLEVHQKTHLPLDIKKTFECKDCGKKFTTPYVREHHISAVHNNAKPYVCDECGMALKSASSLKTHMRTHSDERPFKCELCPKTFKHYHGLKRHKEAHSSQKYVCSTCGFEVSTRSSLKRHMIIHLDVKLYKCEFCAQQFKRAEGYKHHLVLHTGLKPYICNFCDRSFAHGSNCRSHLKKSHPKELAELEKNAGRNTAGFTNNVPKMEQLKAITKNANNIHHVHSKKINFSNKTQQKTVKNEEDVSVDESCLNKS